MKFYFDLINILNKMCFEKASSFKASSFYCVIILAGIMDFSFLLHLTSF